MKQGSISFFDMLPFRLLFIDKKTPDCSGVSRAIDGARTRGLDLGKVARYQLRHYRICFVEVFTSATSHTIPDEIAVVKCFFDFFSIFFIS